MSASLYSMKGGGHVMSRGKWSHDLLATAATWLALIDGPNKTCVGRSRLPPLRHAWQKVAAD